MNEHEGRYSQETHTSLDATGATSFDDLAKGLASGNLSRRKALRMLGAILVGGALASVPGVAWAAPCPSPRIRCAGQCCAAGVTTCQGTGRNKTCGPVPCPTGQQPCNGLCVATATDVANCGSCGNACATGQGCVYGRCFDICVDVDACCCSCQYVDNNTGRQFVESCAITAGTSTQEQCITYCENNVPEGPEGSDITYDTFRYGCAAAFSGRRIYCDPEGCTTDACAPA